MPEVAKILGAQWKALGVNDRAPYMAQAVEDKKRYAAAMSEYLRVAPNVNVPAKRAKKDPNAPKRGKSAYIFFCSAKRPEVMAKNPNARVPELGTMLGALWKALPVADRAPYQAEAALDKKRYDAALEAIGR